MITTLNFLKKKGILESLFFLFIGILSIIFFEERLYSDSSYYIGRVIQHDSFWVEHNRYVLILSQWLPFIGMKLGLGIKPILILYSVGNVLFYYLIYLVCKFKFDDKNSGLLLLLLQTLSLMSGFFVPMFELYYAAALLVLFSAILRSSNNTITILPLCILAVFILTAHFYAYILLGLVLALNFESSKFKYLKHYVVLALLMIGLIIFKKNNISEYELGKSLSFLNNLKNAKYDLNYIQLLGKFIFKYYIELSLLLITLIGLLIKDKKVFRLLIVVGVFLITLSMIQVSLYGFQQSRYQEQVYFPLSFIVGYPLSLYYLNHRKTIISNLLYISCFVIISIRILGIINESEHFSTRINEMKSLITTARAQPGNKFIIANNTFKNDANWSFSIETMLLSSYDGPNSTVTICTQEDIDHEDNITVLSSDKFLFRRWEIYPLTELNKNYYNLDDSPYLLLDSGTYTPSKLQPFIK